MLIQCNVCLYSYYVSSLFPSQARREKGVKEQNLQIHSGTLQIARQENCLPALLPPPCPLSPSVSVALRGPMQARSMRRIARALPDYREALSFAGHAAAPRRSGVVILGVAAVRPIKLQTPRNRNALRTLPLHPSFPTRRDSAAGSE